MKVYTRKGDTGKTGLYNSPGRHSKTLKIFEVLGNFDELSAGIGLITSRMNDSETQKHFQVLEGISRTIINICSRLAETSSVKTDDVKFIVTTEQLEECMNSFEETLPELNTFLVGTYFNREVAAQAFFVRTIARKTERSLLEYQNKISRPVPGTVWINRLSDYFFELARILEHELP